jgi:predicted lipoprotein with Yx(FWY)xxD motif
MAHAWKACWVLQPSGVRIPLPPPQLSTRNGIIKAKEEPTMQRTTTPAIGIVIVLILIIGGYFIFHKSSPNTTTSSYGSSTSATNSSNTKEQASTVTNAVLITKNNASVGNYLAEPNGVTLYTYGGDTSDTSNCTGSCLSNWPAYQDAGSTSGLPTNVSTIKRTDNGEIQYTYKGKPLYTFIGDSKGQVTGNGVSDFSVAKP